MAKKGKPGTLTRPPATTPEELARITQVFLWIVQGQAEGHILEAIRATWPDQEPKPIIAAAIEELAKSADFNPKVIRGWCFEAYRDLYRRLYENGDFVGALRAVKLLQDMAARGPAA